MFERVKNVLQQANSLYWIIQFRHERLSVIWVVKKNKTLYDQDTRVSDQLFWSAYQPIRTLLLKYRRMRALQLIYQPIRTLLLKYRRIRGLQLIYQPIRTLLLKYRRIRALQLIYQPIRTLLLKYRRIRALRLQEYI